MTQLLHPTKRVACPVCDQIRTAAERIVAGFQLERCVNCGFVFMNPRYTDEQLLHLYSDRGSERLDAIYNKIATSPSVRAEYEKKLDLLESMRPARGRMLDFACGAGHFFELARGRGWDAHGLEVGTWAAQAAADRGLPNLHIGTLQTVDFGAKSFDVVYAAQVLEHLPNPGNDLKEIRRILKPGGIFYVDVPNYRTLSILAGRDDFMLNEPPQHLNYFTAKTLRRLLEGAGFRILRVGSGGGLKWENLLGRKIQSEIASAYGLVPEGGRSSGPGQSRNHGSALKTLLMRSFVQPVLYDTWKVGMVLFAVATSE